MTSRILDVVEDIMSGEIGLLLTDIHQINAFMTTTSGRIIAHDIIEHQNGLKSIGSIDDELEALGACWYVRAFHGHLTARSMYSPEEALARDIANLGIIFARGVNYRTPVPNTKSNIHDDAFNEMLEIGCKTVRTDYLDQFDSIDAKARTRMCRYERTAIHYLRTGFNKAAKRFRCHEDGFDMFSNIEEAVNNITPEISYVGQQFRLTYTRERAYCHEIYEERY